MQDDKHNLAQLEELRRKLSVMSATARDGRKQKRYFQCNLEGDKIPPARAIQTLVQAWKEMREWSKRK